MSNRTKISSDSEYAKKFSSACVLLSALKLSSGVDEKKHQSLRIHGLRESEVTISPKPSFPWAENRRDKEAKHIVVFKSTDPEPRILGNRLLGAEAGLVRQRQ